jgi:hypothetical protein
MLTQLLKAIETGVLWGVKLLAALAIVLLGLGWAVNDYRAMRLAAQHGEEAYQQFVRLAEMQKQAQAAQAQAPSK